MTTTHHQTTLARSVSCTGVGVHSGKEITVTLLPAPVNHGIQFIRSDLMDCPVIPANLNRVVDTSLATVLGAGGCIVSTIEHLMSACYALGIDNVRVEMDAYEMPILDGSARLFAEMIQEAGRADQNGPRIVLAIQEPLELRDGDRFVGVYPHDSLKVTYTIEYDHPLIGRQSLTFDTAADRFEEGIAPARTFGFLHEYEYMKQMGLAQGGSLENVLVIDEDSVLNPDGLRFPDEFVRHKILDCIGDFSLLGMPLIGHVVAEKSGHAFHHTFLQHFFESRHSWRTITLDPDDTDPVPEAKQLAI